MMASAALEVTGCAGPCSPPNTDLHLVRNGVVTVGLSFSHVTKTPSQEIADCGCPLVAGSRGIRRPPAGFLCGLLSFRINKPVSAHRVQRRGGGLKFAHLRATLLLVL
jgi:hypothetical protein